MTCFWTHTYAGPYDPNKIIVCYECGVDYDHKLIKGGEVKLAHRCGRPTIIYGTTTSPCCLAAHPAWIGCLAETMKAVITKRDYTGHFPRAVDRLERRYEFRNRVVK